MEKNDIKTNKERSFSKHEQNTWEMNIGSSLLDLKEGKKTIRSLVVNSGVDLQKLGHIYMEFYHPGLEGKQLEVVKVIRHPKYVTVGHLLKVAIQQFRHLAKMKGLYIQFTNNVYQYRVTTSSPHPQVISAEQLVELMDSDRLVVEQPDCPIGIPLHSHECTETEVDMEMDLAPRLLRGSYHQTVHKSINVMKKTRANKSAIQLYRLDEQLVKEHHQEYKHISQPLQLVTFKQRLTALFNNCCFFKQ